MLSTDSLIGRSAAGRVCEFGLAAVIVCVLLLVLAWNETARYRGSSSFGRLRLFKNGELKHGKN